jgi:hypothetical protein
VHRGPGLGDRDVLRDHRAADVRDHQHRGRGRVRRRALVWHPAGPARDRLVHRPDRHPHDDEDGGRSRPQVRPGIASLPRERRRAAQPGGGDVGAGGVRPAVPRQLVADRDGRDHDRQLRGHGHPPGLHGPAAARCRGGDRPEDRRGPGGRRRGTRRAGGAGTPTRMALHVPRLLAGARALPQVLRRRFLPHRRSRAAGPRRLLLVRGPRRRRDQELRASHRTVRGREHPDGAPGGRGGRRDRQAGPGGDGGGQGLRLPQGRLRAHRGAAARPARLRPHPPRGGGGPQGDRVPAAER